MSPPPSTLADGKPIPLSTIKIVEPHPPEGESPAQWFLLITLRESTAQQVGDMTGFHFQRWRIENFFRVLKPGCSTEFLLFRPAERLQRAIAIDAVVV